MPRYRLTLEYDGTHYAGWQRQEEQLSIQECLEEAIFCFCQVRVQAFAAGRTDSGVHARGQVVHIDLPREMTPFTIQRAINFHLKPHPIMVVEARPVSDDFHARFSAIRRHYRYHIINREAPLALDLYRAWHLKFPLDVSAMQQGANHLIGQHDCTSFRAKQCQAKSPIITIDHLSFTTEGDRIFMDISARSFLHHMVRNIIGTLVQVGLGRMEADHVKTILEAKDRAEAGPTAPPSGLYFMHVDYGEVEHAQGKVFEQRGVQSLYHLSE